MKHCCPRSLPRSRCSRRHSPARPIFRASPFASWCRSPPGGGTDVVARMLAERLAPVLGVPVLVDNKPGRQFGDRDAHVALAPADGHTLLLTTDIHAINAAYGGALPYDSLKDFAFVTQLTTSPLMLVPIRRSGMRTLADW